ncbi:MAG: class I SAM-dependent methyltransferase [Candidatus Hydrogenedentes bacterium]|nr:class I SAM-dependent methyltransferase [Candidatus Hydrogenedentota bacterium]
MASSFLAKWRRRLGLYRDIGFLYRTGFFTNSVTACPICASSDVIFEAKNDVSELDRCKKCNHVYTRKQPRDYILRIMYGDFGYWVKDKAHQGIHSVEYGPQWEGFIKARVGIMERCGMLDGKEAKRFFEIGCSEGILLKALVDRGHQASGCEMNVAIAEAGRRSLGVDISSEKFENLRLDDSCFDGIVSFHTVEHVNSPHSVLKKSAKLLKPSGAILIEVPIGEEEYANTDHLHFFSRESLRALLDTYFEESEIIDNCYTNCNNVLIGSVYGFGRRPRRG